MLVSPRTRNKTGIAIFSIFFWVLVPSFLLSQVDYNSYYRSMNPSHQGQSAAEKRVTIDSFLRVAQQARDTVHIIHAYLYLENVDVLEGSFTSGMEKLIAAEAYAEQQDNKLLLGRIYHKKATIYTCLYDYTKALKTFAKSLSLSAAARDSQFIAITYEQMGAVYGYQEEYDKANEYYQMALPLIERYCGPRELNATYANHGIVLSNQGRSLEAIAQYRKAIELSVVIDDEYRSIPCRQNLAWEYVQLDSFVPAREIYYQCLEICRRNDWQELMIYNYSGLSSLYEARGQFDSALYYYQAYHDLSEQIIGSEVQTDISEIEADRKLREKELARLEEQALAVKRKETIQQVSLAAIILLVLSGGGLLLMYRQKKDKDRKLKYHQDRLLALTMELQHKNRQQRDQQADVSEDIDYNPYEHKILTADDWQEFKTTFEASYPGYLRRLRSNFPDLSEAEERLFLLLKLKLTAQEIANILGIQIASVRKTRTRLRHRLHLPHDTSLKTFVQTF